MKNLRFFITSVLFIYFTTSVFSRSIQDKQFAIFSYEVIIDDNFRDEIADLDDLINTIRSYTGKKQDKLEGKIFDIAYPYLEKKLENKYEIDILPVNTFTDNIKYNRYNYPATSIKKAQELGNSHYYLKIIIYVETSTPKTKEAKNSILYQGKTTPKVVVEIEAYDKIGILPLGKAVGVGKASTPQKIEDDFLKGIIRPVKEEEIPALGENLMGVLYDAIERVVKNFRSAI